MALTQVSSAGIKNAEVKTEDILDNAVTGAKVADNLDIPDNNKIRFGTGNDLELYHDGSNSYLKNAGTGNIIFLSDDVQFKSDGGGHTGLTINTDGAVEAYYNNVKTAETATGGLILYGTEGQPAYLYMYADEGDDNADKWVHRAATDGSYSLRNFSTGAWVSGLTLDSSNNATFAGDIDLADSKKIKLGTGDDLQIYHDGSDSYVNDAGTGRLKFSTNYLDIKNAAHNETMIQAQENGSVDLYYDNSKKLETTSAGVKASGNVDLDDSNKVRLGDAGDLSIYHDGSHSYLANTTGNLYITEDGYIELSSANGGEKYATFSKDGSVELYHDNSKKLETTSSGVSATGKLEASTYIRGNDNVIVQLGTANDLQIYHDGTINRIRSNVQTVIEKTDSEDIATFIPDGAVSLFYDGSKKFETVTGGATITGVCTATSFAGDGSNLTGVSSVGGSTGVDFNDNVKARFGTGNDLEIYHNGNGSFIENVGTGSLNLYGDEVGILNKARSEWKANFISNGAVELYYNSAKKIETTSTGVNVTGGIRLGGNNAANECDDYEEGTFTPVLNFGGIGVPGYASRVGTYTKVGNVVHFRAIVELSDKGSNTGQALMYGLPFTNNGGSNQTALSTWNTSMEIPDPHILISYVGGGAVWCKLDRVNDSNGDVTDVTGSHFNDNSQFQLAGSYFTTA